MGLVVLLGWAIDSDALKGITSSLPATKANTALGLIGCGIALLCLRHGTPPRAQRLGRALAAMVAALGAVVVAEYLFGGIGIDELFFADAHSTYPGRPSPHTAVAFVLVGLAIATVDVRGRAGRQLNAAVTALASIIVLFAVVGYIFGVDYLRGVSGTTGVAIQTLGALVAVMLGTIWLRPERGLGDAVEGRDSGARMARTLLPVVTVATLAVGAAWFFAAEAGLDNTISASLYTVSMVIMLVVVVLLTARRLRAVGALSRRLATVVESSGDAIVSLDAEGRFQSWNPGATALFGFEPEEIIGRPLETIVPTGERAPARSSIQHARRGETVVGLETRRLHKDGHLIDVELTVSPITDEDGRIVGSSAVIRDIRKRIEARRRFAESQERFRRSFEDSGVGMALAGADRGHLGPTLEANDALAAITGYSSSQLRAMGPFTTIVHPDDLSGLFSELADLFDGKLAVVRREVRLIDTSRKPIWVGLSISLVKGPTGEVVHALLQIQDISERKRFEGQLQYLADHDPLTGLFNRRRFEQELEREVASARRYGYEGAVLVLDLDHFKYVNDSLGHAAGDELITLVSTVLRKRLREADVIGRMGGDEFAVILQHADRAVAERMGRALLEEIRSEVRAPVAGGPRRVTASLGIAAFGPRSPQVGPDELLAEADIAMYDAKEAGRDRIAAFDAEAPRHERMQARLAWAERIERAIEEEQFVLHAQPILPLGDGDRHRCELLVRMVGDDGDLIPPGTFLYVAERFGLAQRIDRWVVTAAIEALSDLHSRGIDASFEVNLSGKTLSDPGTLDFIVNAVTDAALDPGKLIFEVTETAAIVNVSTANRFAERLQRIGCAFALDDFGAGFASFYYIKHLPFDYVKIDGEFIQQLASSRTDQLVVKSVVDIAHGLGKQTIAEFVGDQATLDMVRRFGVDYAQGFFMGRPVPLEDFDFQRDPVLSS